MIKEGSLKINSFEINDKFKVDYKFCITDNECYDSYEYIVPNFKNNYDKTILKINGNIDLKETNINSNNLYEFMKNYGTIIYTVNGITKKQNVSLEEVKLSKTTINNTYYVEILKEIKDAENVSIEFNLRNNKYIYKLK